MKHNSALYDTIVIGAGVYGLYAAIHEGRKGRDVLVLERDSQPFSRATYVNQARVHQGYHYPRSLSTAKKSAGYFLRFCKEYGSCIKRDFKQIYATSKNFSWSDAVQFKAFCEAARIPCEAINPERYFRQGMCDGAFLTEEFTFDALILKELMLSEIARLDSVRLCCDVDIERIERDESAYRIRLADGRNFETPFVLNATYASSNEVLHLAGFEDLFKIKYELCEIILCSVDEALMNVGITLMDGPFFSIMPFGKSGFHSLTSVTFTPHLTSYGELPTFPCQQQCSNGFCTPLALGNCNECSEKPRTAFPYMAALAHKYLRSDFDFSYQCSLFSMKPILVSSEIDDSRPTVIRYSSHNPTFVSVLSGKINTIYDLEEVLDAG